MARDKWLKAQFDQMSLYDAMVLRARHDREDPWFFVEWCLRNRCEHDDPAIR